MIAQPAPTPSTQPDPELASVASEIALLHGALNGKSLHGAVLEQLEPGMFYQMMRGWIYAAMLELHAAGQTIGVDTVLNRMAERGEAEVIMDQGQRGEALLRWLKSDEAAPAADATMRDYAQIIRNKHTRRMMDKAADELKLAARDEKTDPVILIERHERKLSSVKPFTLDRAFVLGKDTGSRHYDILSAQATAQAWCLTPFKALTDKGIVIPDGYSAAIVGPEGSGKSALLHTWAVELAQDAPTVYIHTEMDQKEVLDRRAASEDKRIRYTALQKPERLTDADWQYIVDAMSNHDTARDNLHYWEAGTVHETQLFTVMQRMVDDFGVQRFVLDYANDVETLKDKGQTQAVAWRNFFARVEEFNRRNKTVMITAAQLNDKGEAYDIGRALRQKVMLYLKLKPKELEKPFEFNYDGIAYQYDPGTLHPVVDIVIEKYRGGGRGTVKALFVGPRYLWVDVPDDMKVAYIDFAGYGDTETNTKIED